MEDSLGVENAAANAAELEENKRGNRDGGW